MEPARPIPTIRWPADAEANRAHPAALNNVAHPAIRHVPESFDVDPTVVRRWIANGLIRAYRSNDSAHQRWRIDPDSLADLEWDPSSLSVAQVARRHGVGSRTVRVWIANGWIEATRLGTFRIPASAVPHGPTRRGCTRWTEG